MKFLIEIDPDDNPDAVGEYLRSAFFDEKTRYLPELGMEHREVGCYETFDWRPEVQPLKDLHQTEHVCSFCQALEEDTLTEDQRAIQFAKEASERCECTYEATWTRGEKTLPANEAWAGEEGSRWAPVTIECRYFWDGDGTLAFGLPDDRWLVNSDCKKDYGWEIWNSEKGFF